MLITLFIHSLLLTLVYGQESTFANSNPANGGENQGLSSPPLSKADDTPRPEPNTGDVSYSYKSSAKDNSGTSTPNTGDGSYRSLLSADDNSGTYAYTPHNEGRSYSSLSNEEDTSRSYPGSQQPSYTYPSNPYFNQYPTYGYHPAPYPHHPYQGYVVPHPDPFAYHSPPIAHRPHIENYKLRDFWKDFDEKSSLNPPVTQDIPDGKQIIGNTETRSAAPSPSTANNKSSEGTAIFAQETGSNPNSVNKQDSNISPETDFTTRLSKQSTAGSDGNNSGSISGSSSYPTGKECECPVESNNVPNKLTIPENNIPPELRGNEVTKNMAKPSQAPKGSTSAEGSTPNESSGKPPSGEGQAPEDKRQISASPNTGPASTQTIAQPPDLEPPGPSEPQIGNGPPQEPIASSPEEPVDEEPSPVLSDQTNQPQARNSQTQKVLNQPKNNNEIAIPGPMEAIPPNGEGGFSPGETNEAPESSQSPIEQKPKINTVVQETEPGESYPLTGNPSPVEESSLIDNSPPVESSKPPKELIPNPLEEANPVDIGAPVQGPEPPRKRIPKKEEKSNPDNLGTPKNTNPLKASLSFDSTEELINFIANNLLPTGTQGAPKPEANQQPQVTNSGKNRYEQTWPQDKPKTWNYQQPGDDESNWNYGKQVEHSSQSSYSQQGQSNFPGSWNNYQQTQTNYPGGGSWNYYQQWPYSDGQQYYRGQPNFYGDSSWNSYQQNSPYDNRWNFYPSGFPGDNRNYYQSWQNGFPGDNSWNQQRPPGDNSPNDQVSKSFSSKESAQDNPQQPKLSTEDKSSSKQSVPTPSPEKPKKPIEIKNKTPETSFPPVNEKVPPSDEWNNDQVIKYITDFKEKLIPYVKDKVLNFLSKQGLFKTKNKPTNIQYQPKPKEETKKPNKLFLEMDMMRRKLVSLLAKVKENLDVVIERLFSYHSEIGDSTQRLIKDAQNWLVFGLGLIPGITNKNTYSATGEQITGNPTKPGSTSLQKNAGAHKAISTLGISRFLSSTWGKFIKKLPDLKVPLLLIGLALVVQNIVSYVLFFAQLLPDKESFQVNTQTGEIFNFFVKVIVIKLKKILYSFWKAAKGGLIY